MLHVSEAASLALHGMALLAQAHPTPLSARQMAATTGVSQAHLAKVMQRLARAGLVTAVRGPAGGYMLNRPANELTLLTVYEAVEGPIAPAHCLVKNSTCPFRECMFSGILGRLAVELAEYLGSRTLADVAG